jgi:hypothetical protein
LTSPGPGGDAGWRAWARWELPALVVTLLLALALRLHDYASAPAITDNGDELDWTWNGLGLIIHGSPYGWSNIHVYPNPAPLILNGKLFQVVHPFLDHPPLFGLLTGAVAWLQGARQLTDVTAAMIRPVPIACSLVALLLAYLLGRRVLGAAPALIGLLLLATAPAAVLLQRQVEAEALLAPLLLGSLLLAHSVVERPGRRAAVAGLLACCAVAPLVKVSGVAVAAIISAVLLGVGRWRLASATLAAGLTGLGAFFVYGAVFDWNLFLRVIAGSEARRYGILGVYQFIAAPAGPAGANQTLRDGWWLLGWLGVALAAFQRERRLDLLGWPIVGYAVVIMLFAEHISYYGWFRITIYPLVYLVAGGLAWRAIRDRSALGLLLLLTVGVFSVVSPLLGSGSNESWAPSPYLVIVFLGILVGPALLAARPQAGNRAGLAAQYTAVAAVALGVSANIVASINLAAIFRGL